MKIFLIYFSIFTGLYWYLNVYVKSVIYILIMNHFSKLRVLEMIFEYLVLIWAAAVSSLCLAPQVQNK